MTSGFLSLEDFPACPGGDSGENPECTRGIICPLWAGNTLEMSGLLFLTSCLYDPTSDKRLKKDGWAFQTHHSEYNLLLMRELTIMIRKIMIERLTPEICTWEKNYSLGVFIMLSSSWTAWNQFLLTDFTGKSTQNKSRFCISCFINSDKMLE